MFFQLTLFRDLFSSSFCKEKIVWQICQIVGNYSLPVTSLLIPFWMIESIWEKVFKNGPSKFFYRLSSTNFTWSILEYPAPYNVACESISTLCMYSQQPWLMKLAVGTRTATFGKEWKRNVRKKKRKQGDCKSKNRKRRVPLKHQGKQGRQQPQNQQVLPGKSAEELSQQVTYFLLY